MAGYFANQPRLLKGALVDTNVAALPPLIVPFQFNPEQLRRQRSTRIETPPSRRGREETTPRDQALGEAQSTSSPPENISLDVRLDASDAMDAGDPVAGRFGILPALSALELMITPRSESFFAGLVGLSLDVGFGDRQTTPVLIFVWGRHRLYPVRLTSLDIQEVEYNPLLNPTRVIASVSLQVIGGSNPFFLFTQAQRELFAAGSVQNAPELIRSVLTL